MICNKCGYSNNSNTKYCMQCGSDMSQQNMYYQQYNNPAQYGYNNVNSYQAMEPARGMAIASMVCGIVSIFIFAFITGTLGIVFGAVAKSKGNKNPMATAGIICGAVGLFLWLMLVLIIIIAEM